MSPQPAGSPTRLDDAALVAVLAVALAVCVRFFDYAYDDAYITYRYARNLAAGHGFVYNLGEAHLGTTTPLYTLLLAGLGLVFPIPAASGALSSASLLGGIALFEAIGRRAGVRFAGSLAGLFCATNLELLQMFGGETFFLHLLLVPLGVHLQQRDRDALAGAVFGLAVLARMDALLFVAVFYPWWMARRRRWPLRQAAALALVVAPWLAYAAVVFGDPLPSTLAVKRAMAATGSWPHFLEGARDTVARLVEYRPPLRVLFVPLFALGLWRIATVERVWVPFVVHAALFAAVYEWVLRVSFGHWYLAGPLVANALVLGAGVRGLHAAALSLGPAATARLPGGRRALRAGVAIVLAAGIAQHLAVASARVLGFPVDSPRRRLYTHIGQWLARNTEPGASVAYHEIGMVGWFSERTIVDRVGLVTPGAAEALLRGDPGWAFRHHRPDYYVLNRRYGVPRYLAGPDFARDYAVATRIEEPGYAHEVIIFRRQPADEPGERILFRAKRPADGP